VTLDVSTPALLFPAVSLLFLAFTNRFLSLAALIRQLYDGYLEKGQRTLMDQIVNLRRRLVLIRWMQLLGALSLLACVVAMVSVMFGAQGVAVPSFIGALALMGGSLVCVVVEIWISGGALRVLLSACDRGS